MNQVVVMPEPDEVDFSRRKVLRVGYSDVLNAVLVKGTKLPDWVYVCKGANIPDGTKVLDVQVDYLSRSFAFTLVHPSFEQVADGDFSPSLAGPFGFQWEAVETKGGTV